MSEESKDLSPDSQDNPNEFEGGGNSDDELNIAENVINNIEATN
jgi:hypothetical protein